MQRYRLKWMFICLERFSFEELPDINASHDSGDAQAQANRHNLPVVLFIELVHESLDHGESVAGVEQQVARNVAA